jgi:predicted lysophospholipase L1 biosynthesis ABC-type transport system permease subunit
VPAIASARFLDQAGLGEGESVTVDSGGRPITLRVIASTELFAPLDPSVPFVVVDGPTLDLDRFAATGDPAPVSEWWLAVDAAQRATTAARLAGPPMSARQVVVRDDVEASLLNDPVSLGVIGALGLGAVAALVFAAVGFLVNASVGTAERRGELAVLRAVGVSGRQLVGWLVVESAVVLAVGLVAGSVLGLVLAEVVLPFASLTASGAPPVPSATVVVPAATLVPIDVAAVVLLVAAWVVAARQVPAIHVSDALRGRDE